MDHDSIIEMMMETIVEREADIYVSRKSVENYEKSEFYNGFSIVDTNEETAQP